MQGLPRGVLRDFDRERPEICGARAPSFFVWFFFRLCPSPLAFDASLFVNCCKFHHGDSMKVSTWGFAEQFQRSDRFVGIPRRRTQKAPPIGAGAKLVLPRPWRGKAANVRCK